jgi:ankyrin repeat protein
MDLIRKKADKSKIIRSMFSAIKRDNLEKLQEIIAEYPNLLYFKNQRRENILFYAFENNSKKIIDFIHSCDPGFIKEKNIRNLNILHELVLANKNIDYFLEDIIHWDVNSVNQLYTNCDPQGNNLLLMAAKSGNLDILKKIINHCPSFDKLQKHSNIYGQNIAHFIACNIFENCQEIIEKLSPGLLKNIDNINGFTPLMLAAYHQKENNFKSFFDLYPNDQISFLGNSLIHFAAHNQNNEVVKLLISNGLYKNNKNLAEQSPLLIALTKGLDKSANDLFNAAKDKLIYQEDIVNAVKISNINWDLFKEIINNFNNEELSQENANSFLENLFLHGKFMAIEEVEKNDRYKKYFDSASIVNLFSKTITGKKDMAFKTFFLLKNKEYLSKEETIGIVTSLEKIPANQVRFLLKSTGIIDKTLEENKILFGALCLEKGLNYEDYGIELKLNNDDDIQKFIKRSLRSVKIEDTKTHFNNIESWLSILEDNKLVWKHYGRIISKNIDPFIFLEEKFKFLSRENKKELVYYAITALFKNENEIPAHTFKVIECHPHLLINVFTGIIKVGKVPENKQLLSILPQIKTKNLMTDDFINVLKKSHRKPKQAITILKDKIDMFDLSDIGDMKDFCNALVRNPFHYEMMEEVVMAIESESKDKLMYSYVDSYISEPTATINMEVLEQLILSHDNSLKIITDIFYKVLYNHKFNNIDFINRIRNLTNQNILPDSNKVQNLIDIEDFNTCLKLKEIGGSELQLKRINFNSIDWESIDRQVISLDKNNKFFDFIENGKDLLTEKQINSLTFNLVSKIKENSISFPTIEKFLTALDQNVHKIEDELLYQLSINVLDNQYSKNTITRFMSQDSFNSIFSSISKNKNGVFFERIRNNENFYLIPKETRIAIDKEILEDTLIVNQPELPKTKKIKL